VQVEDLVSKHKCNGPEAPDAFISSKLLVLKQPREDTCRVSPKYCFHSKRKQTKIVLLAMGNITEASAKSMS